MGIMGPSRLEQQPTVYFAKNMVYPCHPIPRVDSDFTLTIVPYWLVEILWFDLPQSIGFYVPV